ncbi:hypothetical protein DMC47_24310 [Nostoc sp. 3335mG]|nr:hypothetical protein DMC47_24310 [Nostoc sp. 3335mG]
MDWWPKLIPLAVAALVLTLRWWRGRRLHRLRLETLWIVPVLVTIVAVVMYRSMPPTGWGWAICGSAAIVGLALGWQRGRMMHIELDPETHLLNHRQSPAAFLFLFALLAMRTILKELLAQGGASALHMSATTLTDGFMAFGWGLIVAYRAEMLLRARAILLAARRG